MHNSSIGLVYDSGGDWLAGARPRRARTRTPTHTPT